jgi:ribosomal protein L11 methyltransferase
MSARKITLEVADRNLAHRTAGALENLYEPAPSALTLFEAVQPCGETAWRIEAYFDNLPDLEELHKSLEEILATPLPAPAAEDIPDLNWVSISQSALPPVVAGRFTVHGSHDTSRVAQGPNSILVEAGEAFGTAHHATTYGCLLAIDRLTRARAFERVLDLGTGSGVLAIAIARVLPHARIFASDLDSRSVEVARENMRKNGVGQRIRAVEAAGLDAPALRNAGRFDLIIANILAEPLIALAPHVARKLAPSGTLVLSGLLNHQAAAVIAAYRAQGLALRSHMKVAGWSTLTLAKRGIAPARAPE